MKRKVIYCLLTGIILMGSGLNATPTVQASKVDVSGHQYVSYMNQRPLRATKIVKKYRIYEGKLQYRRWNETSRVWVDPDWIDE